MSTEIYEGIYKGEQDNLSQRQIATNLNIHYQTVNKHINSDDYRIFKENKEKERELLHNSDPAVRTRNLINHLLDAAEKEMSEATTNKQRLALTETVKRLVDICGIESDDNADIPVVEVPELIPKDQFNQMSEANTLESTNVDESGNPLMSHEVSSDGFVEEELCTGESTHGLEGGHCPQETHESPQGSKIPTLSGFPDSDENSPDDIWEGFDIKEMT